MINAVIIAGGRGECLRPLTDRIPKPLLKVGGKTLLEHNIVFLQKNGVKEITVVTGYLSEKIKKYLASIKITGVRLRIVKEEKPMGTAGFLPRLKKTLNSTFVVCYADILRRTNMQEMLAVHRNSGAIGTICVYQNLRKQPKSLVEFDEKNVMISFRERPDKEKLPATVWSNGSLYIFEPEVLDHIKEGETQDFGNDILPKMLTGKKKLLAYLDSSYFLDVGTLDKLKQARKDFKLKKFS